MQNVTWRLGVDFIKTETEVNRLVWITSLRPQETGTTKRVLEDLVPMMEKQEIHVDQFEPESANALLEYISMLTLHAKQGFRPIIHLDLHGSQQSGFIIANSNETVPWSQIVGKLRYLNEATQNNLIVVSFACFSIDLLAEIDFQGPSPFSCLIAPEKEVTAGFIEDNTVRFYEMLFKTNNINSSFRAHLSQHLRQINSEGLLIAVLVRYFSDKCTGKELQKRTDALITQARQHNILAAYESPRLLRREIKKFLKPNTETFKRYASQFLCGKTPDISPHRIIQLAETASKVKK